VETSSSILDDSHSILTARCVLRIFTKVPSDLAGVARLCSGAPREKTVPR
jgi:hypothetical protein